MVNNHLSKLVNDASSSVDIQWQVTWFFHVLQHSVAEASFFLGVYERTVERFISKFPCDWRCKVGDDRPFIRGNEERLPI